MKYFLFSIFLLFTSFHFKNITSSNIEVITAISADKVNVFYIGVDNPVSIAISNVFIEDTKVSIDKGTITPTDTKGHYHVRVFEAGKVTVFLEGTDSKGNRINISSEFRVKRIPDPNSIANLMRGHGRTNSLNHLRELGLYVYLKDFDFNVRFEVLSYEFQHVRKGAETKTYFNKGGKFTSEIQDVISASRIGDVYFFHKIKVKAPDGTIRKMESFSFKIR